MDEARRFLRYVTPVALFGVEVLLFVGLLAPWVISGFDVGRLEGEKGIPLVIAAVLGSGGLGLLISVIHHALFWSLRYWGIDYTSFVRVLENEFGEELSVFGQRRYPSTRSKRRCWHHFEWSQKFRARRRKIGQRQRALSVLTNVWFHYRGQFEGFDQATDRLKSFGDMVHGLGTAIVATGAAFFTAVALVYPSSQFSFAFEPAVRAIAFAASVLLIWKVLTFNYWNTRQLTREYFESCTYAALLRSRKKSDRNIRANTR